MLGILSLALVLLLAACSNGGTGGGGGSRGREITVNVNDALIAEYVFLPTHIDLAVEERIQGSVAHGDRIFFYYITHPPGPEQDEDFDWDNFDWDEYYSIMGY